MMYGHPIAKQLEAWWKEHGGNEKSAAWHTFIEDYARLMLSKQTEMTSAHENDGRFGMSKAGGCTRAAILKLQGAASEPFSGSTRVTFFIGHIIEVIGIASLRAIGIDASPTTADGAQHTTRIDPFMHSASDARIVLDGVETILSMKSAGYKTSGFDKRSGKYKRFGFAQFPFDGVLKTSPGHYAQLQAEMHGSGYKQALELVVAKDIIKAMENDPYIGPNGNGSLTFYAEIVPYDETFAKEQLLPVWAEAWQSYERGEPGRALVLNGNTGKYVELDVATEGREPNASKTNTYNPCDYCDLFNACKKANAAENAA